MEGSALAGTALAVLIGLILLRVPIAVAMIGVGAAGYSLAAGWGPLLQHLKTGPFWLYSTYDLSVVPLFLLMGQFAMRAGLSRALFDAANGWLGHRRGGVAMAAVGGCAGFGAICGSSLATAATMGQVALPELRRLGYAGGLATGALAAGGTLGILIPPSVVLVIYAVLAEANIVTLFQAALVPALLAVGGHMAAIALVVRLRPGSGPAGPRAGWGERWRRSRDVWPVAALFVLVIGGIYAGLFTPTEAAAVGALGTGAVAALKGRLGRRDLAEVLYGTAATTAMIFLILLGADLLNAFLAFTRLPAEAAAWFSASGLAPLAVLLLMLTVYLLLGCVMDSLSMILLTVPVFWPILAGQDLGLPPGELKTWFGILALTVVEVGLITPPVGLNVFVIDSLARDVRTAETFRGVLPFLAADALRITALVALPALTLALPRWLG